MKLKPVLTIALLLFVTFSVVAIVVKEKKASANEKSTAPKTTIADQTDQAVQTNALPDRTVVYYFHGNKRCMTCKKIESYTKTAVLTEFESALKNGSVELCVINVEEPENEHFVQDFELTNRSVVVARVKDNEQKSWKNLDQVWNLVGDEGAFIDYIQKETLQMQKGES